MTGDPTKADVNAGFRYGFDVGNTGPFQVVDSAGPTYQLPAESLKRGGSLVVRGRVTVRLEDVLAVKSLVERVGAEHLRTLVAAFER